MCIHYGHEDVADVEKTDTPSSKSNKRNVKLIRTSKLQGWYTRTCAETANTKCSYMDKNGFKDIITEFAPKFEKLKQLTRKLQSILFLIKDETIFTNTFRDHNIIYRRIINVFDRAIGCLGKEEQAIA